MSEEETKKNLIDDEDNLENEEKEKKKKKNSYIRYILNIVIVLIVTITSFCVTFFTDYDTIVGSFSNVDWLWVLLCLGLVILTMLIRSLIYFCFARLYTRKYHYHQAIAIDQIGTFYNGVTPSASGGQFMQAYTYKKQGLSISSGASIMVMASMVYQFVLIILGILSLIFESATIFAIPAVQIGDSFSIPILPLIIIGFGLNVAFILLLLLMSYSRHFHHFILGPCINFLHIIHILKRPDKTRENLRIQVENFKIELKRLLSNIPFTILITLLYTLSMAVNFAVPCFVGKALGANYEITWFTVWDSIFFSNFHQMITGLIPIPGSAGVSEYFFNQLFESYYGMVNGNSITSTAQIIWRFLTFTLPLLVGGIVAAFYRASPKEQVTQRNINRQTFVALQRETYIERKQSADTLYETTRLTRQAIMSSLRLRNRKEAEERKKRKEEKDKLDKAKLNNQSNHEKSILDSEEWNEIDIGDDD